MSDKTYCLISKLIAGAGFCFLVYAGSPWWGLCCILLAAGLDRKLG